MDKVEVKINIQVGSFKLPLTVNQEDEPIYREAARMINDRLEAYQTKYRAANLTQEYMLSFSALDIAVRLVRQQRTTDIGPVEEIIKSLTAELEDFNQTR